MSVVLTWLYRARPGPTAAHLWHPDAANPLCGLTTRGSGDWLPDTGEVGRCGLCHRKRARYYPSVPIAGERLGQLAQDS